MSLEITSILRTQKGHIESHRPRELALERAFNVQTWTMSLWLFNMQNRKRKVLTINCLLLWFCFNKGPNNQAWASCGRFKIRLTPLNQDVQRLLIDWRLFIKGIYDWLNSNIHRWYFNLYYYCNNFRNWENGSFYNHYEYVKFIDC